MARAKEDLSKLSINQIETLTGSSYRSIVKFLADAKVEPIEITENAKFYDPQVALPVIFESMGHRTKKPVSDFDGAPDIQDDEFANSPDLTIQNARLAWARANKVIFELEVEKKNYVLAGEVEIKWGDMIAAAKAKLLALPEKMSSKLAVMKDSSKIETYLAEEIGLSLAELSQDEAKTDRGPGEVSNEDLGASSEIDNKPVGESISET